VTDPVDRMIDDAAGALRAETSGPSASTQSTRARILATHRARSARSSQVTTWLAMAAAVLLLLGGSTAWAYWTGRLDRFLGLETPAEPSTAAAPESPPAPASTHRTATAPITPPIVPEIAPVPDVAPVVTPEAPPSAVETAVAEPETPPASDEEPVDPAERRAYREAHRLHFEDHDAGAAIVAWDRYLRTYPRGRFALEARYNRALCLVRTGRHEEARAALEPFVRGSHGGYRQAEATALYEALGDE
jgi:hypothetical protein